LSPGPALTDPFAAPPGVSPPRPPTLMTRHPIAQIPPNGNPISQENWLLLRRFLQNRLLTPPPLRQPPQRLPQFFTHDVRTDSPATRKALTYRRVSLTAFKLSPTTSRSSTRSRNFIRRTRRVVTVMTMQHSVSRGRSTSQ